MAEMMNRCEVLYSSITNMCREYHYDSYGEGRNCSERILNAASLIYNNFFRLCRKQRSLIKTSMGEFSRENHISLLEKICAALGELVPLYEREGIIRKILIDEGLDADALMSGKIWKRNS